MALPNTCHSKVGSSSRFFLKTSSKALVQLSSFNTIVADKKRKKSFVHSNLSWKLSIFSFYVQNNLTYSPSCLEKHCKLTSYQKVLEVELLFQTNLSMTETLLTFPPGCSSAGATVGTTGRVSPHPRDCRAVPTPRPVRVPAGLCQRSPRAMLRQKTKQAWELSHLDLKGSVDS